MATSMLQNASSTQNITSNQKVVDMARPNLSGHIKFSLIDLEAQRWVTRRKLMHRERLNERTYWMVGCDSLSCNDNLNKKLQINISGQNLFIGAFKLLKSLGIGL